MAIQATELHTLYGFTLMLPTIERTHILGSSPVAVQLRETIERIARSDAKVLITGESGSGKELVAQALHASSPRA